MSLRGKNSEASRKGEGATAEPSPAPSSVRRPQNTRVIQLLKRPRTIVNHSYVDYSLAPFEMEENTLPEFIEKMDFHQKMHSILGQEVESKGACQWLPHGRAFQIIDPVRFEKSFCSKYFGHNRYSSFLHQLGIHGYKLLSKSPQRNVYYSQLFLRGLPHLTKYMPPPKKVFRHLTQDPDNEPDFDTISLIAPLPSDAHFGKPLTTEGILEFCRDTGRNERQVLQQFQALLLVQGDEILRQRVEALH